ncbi:PREDICTED: uncharacterized protein LOC100635744 [Amphimedon queenslandica]|uniref:MARVEL domain-containing protein n=1 Tax=Amphimedon queenslandica TaxID=400682 RepID=A0A1X7U441_AMPQE|nr:PREDICTED: uncharacterized protein LOC100635744 [Amphimedon queenslandica]|eukprot:XP_003389011.1 PREDICTED: uncharacterized protein LOC100635744 [Amphimedon queenslandica]
MAQQTSYSYNYQYSWQTTPGGPGAPGGPPPGPPQETAAPQAYHEETRTTNEDGSNTTTVTGGFSAATTTETGPTESEGQSSPSGSIGAGFDHTYLRSIEGILRLISIPLAAIFFIINAADYRTGGEWFNIMVAIGWIVYAIIVIVIEVFILNFYVHRLLDGIVCLVYVALWSLAVLICIIDAARFDAVGIGISVIFGVAVAILVGVNAFFALRTWKTYENGRKGSVAIFII